MAPSLVWFWISTLLADRIIRRSACDWLKQFAQDSKSNKLGSKHDKKKTS